MRAADVTAIKRGRVWPWQLI